MIHREYTVKNGEHNEMMIDFKCDNCGVIMDHLWPIYSDDHHKDYCGDCSFELGFIDGFKYAKTYLYFTGAYYAEYIDGETHCYTEKSYKKRLKRQKEGGIDKRNSPEYKYFRKKVFERDEYTCTHCDKIGGELNAHHIKSYKKYKKLRLDISNAITLCFECHKKEHRRINALV